MKKIISVFLAGTLVFSFSGCFSKKKITPEDVKNRVIGEAKEYLKENYPDDTFTYVSGRSPNWAYPYYELAFSSAEYENQELTVFAEPDEELKNDEGLTVYHYSDNYFQYYMKDDAEEYFYNLAKPYFGDDFVVKIKFYTGIGGSDKVTNNMDFKNFIDQESSALDIYYFHYADNEFKDINKVINSLKKVCIMRCSFNKILNGYEEFVKSNNIGNILHSDSDCYFEEKSYIIDKNGEIIYSEVNDESY